jgi:hypothetical protein
MLKDVIQDHRLPIAAMMAAQSDGFGGMTPAGGGATPYDSMSPMVRLFCLPSASPSLDSASLTVRLFSSLCRATA